VIVHPATRILYVGFSRNPSFAPLAPYLTGISHLRLENRDRLPANLDGADVVVTQGESLEEEDAADLADFVRAGHGWLHLVLDAGSSLPRIFGVSIETLGCETELRVLFENPAHPVASRLPDAMFIDGSQAVLSLDTQDAETVLYADWHFTHRPVLTVREEGRGRAACSVLRDMRHPVLRQIFYRLLRYLGGHAPGNRTIGVGILGYAPSVGKIHGIGVQETSGLELKAVCDLNAERRKQAARDFPGVATPEGLRKLAQDPSVELVIVATPPNDHAESCLQLLTAGKHVVCEKPLALNRREAEAMAEAAQNQRRHLSCHQNRRWDPDYLAIKAALGDGAIGDPFYLEAFVGGFNHPCGYWHSHTPISGGTAYDWGGHYVDWIVSLMPHRVEAVVGIRHKRVWHDVTNADQERIQIRFEGGREAEFLHSDIAAVRKPKWYILGSGGAILGNWRDVTSFQVDPLLYFREDCIPATEMPPTLLLYRRESPGRIVQQPMLLPPRDPFGFHRNLADHLLTGEPLTAPLEDSIKVVEILEAAARSMEKGGSTEVLHG
jgi:predicted dehydrogenase